MASGVKFDVDQLMGVISREVGLATIKAAEAVRKEAIRLIKQGPKSGRMYGRHRASAPGEPPATDTGFLISSIYTRYELSNYRAYVGVGANYGVMLEYGTQHIAPRPFMRPALAKVEPEIRALYAQAVERALARFHL